MDPQSVTPSPPRKPSATPKPLPTQPVDPIERIVPLGLKLFAMFICGVLLYQAAESASAFPPLPQSMLYSLYYVGIITPLHEGGHFLFMFFGRTLYIFGGSFWQVAIPLILFGVAIRQRSFFASVWLSLAGLHLLPLSSYIMDAPYRTLPLLGGHKSGHDWYNLLIHWQMLNDAESIADFAYYFGLVMGLAGIAGGTAWAIRQYFKPPQKSSAALESD